MGKREEKSGASEGEKEGGVLSLTSLSYTMLWESLIIRNCLIPDAMRVWPWLSTLGIEPSG